MAVEPDGLVTLDDVLRMVQRYRPRARPWTEISVSEFAHMLRDTTSGSDPCSRDGNTDLATDGDDGTAGAVVRVVAICGLDGRDSGWTIIGDQVCPPAGWDEPWPDWAHRIQQEVRA